MLASLLPKGSKVWSEQSSSDVQQSAVSWRRAGPGDAGNELDGIFSDQDTQDNGCCHSAGTDDEKLQDLQMNGCLWAK